MPYQRFRSITIIAAGVFCAIVACSCHIGRGMPAAPKKQASCFHCHDDLSETLPEKHAAVAEGGVEVCLKCHGAGRQASPLDWIAHAAHYAGGGFEGNCFACHIQGKVSIFGRTQSQESAEAVLTEAQALRLTPFFKSWAASDYLDFRHNQHKVTCGLCHGAYSPEKGTSREQCLNCHDSYEHVAALTSDVDPNPHDSHYGKIRCTLCHKAHGESSLYCNTCHDFDLQVP